MIGAPPVVGEFVIVGLVLLGSIVAPGAVLLGSIV
jgi:hypothetical protein